MLLLGDAGDVHEGAAVARIDGESGFEEILGLLELAGGNRLSRLALKLNRLRQDLIVGTLAGGGRGKRQANCANQQGTGKRLHQALHQPSTLARTLEPRDEKSVGAVVPWGEQSAGTIRTPSGNGRILTNPR